MMSFLELRTPVFCCFVFLKQRNENNGMLAGFPFFTLHRGLENMTPEYDVECL